jgi:hypothetical protein
VKGDEAWEIEVREAEKVKYRDIWAFDSEEIENK